MKYRDVFDALTDGIPRRKHSPEHWLTALYFRGARIGDRLYRIIKRSPLTILWRGIKEGWGDE